MGSGKERHEDHEEGVGQRAVEGIKKLWVGEPVVRLVGLAVEPLLRAKERVHFVLSQVHQHLETVLKQQLLQHLTPYDAALERIVALRHEAEHPSAAKVATEHHKSFRLGKVFQQGMEKVVRLRATLLNCFHWAERELSHMKPVIDDNCDLAHNYC